MNIIFNSPFEPKDLRPGSRYYSSSLLIHSFAENLKPALERLLDEDLKDWRSYSGDIVLNGIKTKGEVKINYTHIPDSSTRRAVKQAIESRMPLIF